MLWRKLFPSRRRARFGHRLVMQFAPARRPTGSSNIFMPRAACPARAAIVDASKARFQREFIRSLRDTGADVTLDPKVAELSEVGKFRGLAKETPWAVEDGTRPLEPKDFEPRASADLFGKIARMAAELGVTSVMAPTHFLRPGADHVWLPIDQQSVALLREALDREGGQHVANRLSTYFAAHTVDGRAIPPPGSYRPCSVFRSTTWSCGCLDSAPIRDRSPSRGL